MFLSLASLECFALVTRHLICIYFFIGFDSGIRLFFYESVNFVEIGQFYENWVAFKVLQPASKAAAIGCLSQKLHNCRDSLISEARFLSRRLPVSFDSAKLKLYILNFLLILGGVAKSILVDAIVKDNAQMPVISNAFDA